MRINVYVPDDLGVAVREQIPGVNISAVVQEALRGLLECEHAELQCPNCGQAVDLDQYVTHAVSRFYRDLLGEWQSLVDKGGTAVGAAQVAKRVAVDAGIADADWLPLPRPPRAASAA